MTERLNEKIKLKKIIFRLLMGEKLNTMEKKFLMENFDLAITISDEAIQEFEQQQKLIEQKLGRLATLIREGKAEIISNKLWRRNGKIIFDLENVELN